MNVQVILDNLHYFLLGAWPGGALGGAALTLLLSAGSALASAVLGLLGGIALSLLRGFWAAPLRLLLGLLRAIPVLLLVFWIYFLLPLMLHIDIPGPLTVMVALSLVGGAYLSHSVAAGIDSIGSGQWHAAQALGMGRLQALRWVILPQALPIMAPSFLNQWVTLIKDTSLAYVIGVAELSFVATQISNRELVHPGEIFLFAALLYLLMCGSLQWLVHRLAQRRHLAVPAPRP